MLTALPVAPASHDAFVPFMEALAQDHPPGIRPGSWMSAPHPCTYAFVVEDASANLYITTAGHCVDFVGQRTEVFGLGEVGTVVALRNAGVGADFALIRIDAARYGEVNPRMAAWGGPVGMVTSAGFDVVAVKHYGYGYMTWQTHETRCRIAASHSGTWDAESFTMHGILVNGDSGSPSVTADGRALGINTHAIGAVLAVPGLSSGTRFDYALSQLEAMTGLDLALVDGGAPVDVCDHT